MGEDGGTPVKKADDKPEDGEKEEVKVDEEEDKKEEKAPEIAEADQAASSLLQVEKAAEEAKARMDAPLKIDVTSPTTGTVKFLSPNKPVEEEMEDVEEFFVKYKN